MAKAIFTFYFTFFTAKPSKDVFFHLQLTFWLLKKEVQQKLFVLRLIVQKVCICVTVPTQIC